MQQVKIFKGVETDSAQLEKEVNDWLAESKVEVKNMFGNIAPQSESTTKSGGLSKSSFAPSDIFLVILYEKP